MSVYTKRAAHTAAVCAGTDVDTTVIVECVESSSRAIVFFTTHFYFCHLMSLWPTEILG